jgi:hypothetical protein
MSNEAEQLRHFATDSGVVSLHDSAESSPFLVGPALSSEKNTYRAGLIPLACWRVEDIRFDFDSSLIRPEIAAELQFLAQLMKEHPDCPLSIFGHADPAGQDEYNKKLSGRRSKAIYALLTREISFWENLYSQPHGNDDWRIRAEQQMLTKLGYTPGRTDGQNDQPTRDALQQFQQDNGLGGNGNTNAATRQKLFEKYMDALCGPDLKLTQKDFLARGADPNGRGDYQGCSEFNPAMLFSQQEHQQYEAASDKTARNIENAPNRRVVLFMFRKDSKVLPEKWPCPTVQEGDRKCRQRFWSDGEQRRSRRLSGARRQFSTSKDTFACRFYHRIATGSPCEQPPPVIDASLVFTAILGLYKPGHNDPEDARNHTTKRSGYLAGYKSDDHLGRIFLNHIPRTGPSVAWQDLWRKDTQYIELEASVRPLGARVPAGAKAIWEWEDPDDPFNESAAVRADAGAEIDPNDYSGIQPNDFSNVTKTGAAAADNVGKRDFPNANGATAPDFEELVPYSMTRVAGTQTVETSIVNGISKVRFHGTNVGGDNFKIKVRFKDHPGINNLGGDETGVMTMWKRVEVEYRKMPSAIDMPVDQVPVPFENAMVQMDIGEPVSVPDQDFLSARRNDLDTDSSRYVKVPPTGVFANENKPGWFLLVGAQRAARDVGTASSRELYAGTATIQALRVGGSRREALVLPRNLTDDVSFVLLEENNETILLTVDSKDENTPRAGQCRLILDGLDYQSDFEPGTGLLYGSGGHSGSYDRTDLYFPGHKLEQPSNAWSAPGLGFTSPVTVRVFSPGARETGGISPTNTHGGNEYFAGRTIIFTRHPAYSNRARVEIGGTWAAGDTATITIDGHDVTYSVVAGETPERIAAGLATVIGTQANVKDSVSALAAGQRIRLASRNTNNGPDNITLAVSSASASGTITANRATFGGSDADALLATIVHELGHAFGFPHKCGYRSFESAATLSCALNYSETWLYAAGTRNIERFVTGARSSQFCARHLSGIRKVHLEDNPALWTW